MEKKQYKLKSYASGLLVPDVDERGHFCYTPTAEGLKKIQEIVHECGVCKAATVLGISETTLLRITRAYNIDTSIVINKYMIARGRVLELTEAGEEYIRNNYGKETAARIAYELGTTLKNVYLFATRVGLPRCDKGRPCRQIPTDTPTPDNIITASAEVFKIDAERITGHERLAECVIARTAVAYIMQYYGYTHHQIAASLNRTHASILYFIKKADAQVEQYEHMNEAFTKVMKRAKELRAKELEQ